MQGPYNKEAVILGADDHRADIYYIYCHTTGVTLYLWLAGRIHMAVWLYFPYSGTEKKGGCLNSTILKKIDHVNDKHIKH